MEIYTIRLDKDLQYSYKFLHMPNTLQNAPGTKTIEQSTKTTTSYRGFASIDQEIEREIAIQWFTSSKKTTYSHRSFLMKKERG